MNLQIKKAERSQVKLKIGISGPSGSGKTYSSLLLASGITDWEKICVLDTENNSASLYDKLGKFNTINMAAPYSPERFVEAIKLCESSCIEVLIIDSASAEWIGPGGCLEINSKMAGSSYINWGKVGIMHAAFVNAILQSPMHIIACLRAKQEYSMDKDSSGKSVVTKLGMAEQTREGFSYEVSLNFTLGIDHYATADKDRTFLFMDKPPFKITPETGKTLLEWANSGSKPIEYKPDPSTIKPDPIRDLTAKLRADHGSVDSATDTIVLNTLLGTKIADIAQLTPGQALTALNKINNI